MMEIDMKEIDFSYYKRLVDKNEGLKNEKNYLLNFLANLNLNVNEKNIENASKKLPLNQNKTEKEDNLITLSNDINLFNSKIQNIENDIDELNEEKKIYSDKLNKIKISLLLQNKEIDEQNKITNEIMDSKREREKLINKYTKENINLDSMILKQDFQIKEQNLKKEEKNDPNQLIHCIWYCFQGSCIQTADGEFIEKLLNIYTIHNIPIIFVHTKTFNKGDSDTCRKGLIKLLLKIYNKDKVKIKK